MYCKKHEIEFDNKVFKIGSKSYVLDCPKCQEERREQQLKQEKQERIESFLEQQRNDRLVKLRNQNIEAEFYNATLDNYIAKTESQKKALTAVKRLVSGEVKKVIMLGENGVGKTHLGSAAVKIKDGKIMTAYEVSLHIRDGIARGKEKESLDELCSYSLLVIDEFGRTKMSEAEKNWHSYIFDKRHVRGLDTMIMGNGHFHKDCPKGGCERCLESMLDNDTISRFCQNGIIMTVVGPDQRRES